MEQLLWGIRTKFIAFMLLLMMAVVRTKIPLFFVLSPKNSCFLYVVNGTLFFFSQLEIDWEEGTFL